MTQPEITFLIAHYNCPEFTGICLDSIRHFCPIPYQIMVGDNWSKPEYLTNLRRLLHAEDEFYQFNKPAWHTDVLIPLSILNPWTLPGMVALHFGVIRTSR